MGTRIIRMIGDDILRKKSRPVDKIDKRILTLLDDMKETMIAANGVGIAAPQVGVLKRVVVIDNDGEFLELINPEIIKQEGEQVSIEGCLSIPGKQAERARPQFVTVKALDRNGQVIEMQGEDTLAKALCHEIDHLNGTLFIDDIIRFVDIE